MADLTGKIIAYESGELTEDETIEFFQELIDSGLAFNLQGSYGRTAQNLIDAGLCHYPAPEDKQPRAELSPAHRSLYDKLNPVELKMPPVWGAVFCWIIGKAQPTKAQISTLCATSDGFLMGSGLLERIATLEHVLTVLTDKAKLTPEEVAEFKKLCLRNIQHWDMWLGGWRDNCVKCGMAFPSPTF